METIKISKELLLDKNLTFVEIGLMANLIAKTDYPTYAFKSVEEWKKSNLGNRIFNRSIQHLKQLGYLSMVRRSKGEVTWTIHNK